MFRHFLIGAVLAGSAFAQADDATQADPAPTSGPSVQVSRPGLVQFGGFWLGAGGAYANGSELSPRSRFYRPCCWHDPWYDVFSPVGIYENCYAYPGQCGFFARDDAAEPGVMLLKTQSDAEVFIDGGYAGSAGDLEKMKLPPGIYNLRIEKPGFEPFERKIYLLSGKKVKIEAPLKALEVQP